MTIQNILQKVVRKEDLQTQEIAFALSEMIDGTVSEIGMSSFLTALTMKGETIEEILGCVKVMREKMIHVHASTDAIDVCGTGGDGKETFNISTAVTFVVAGCGVPVVKHGNRAASSRCGSADVLEALGVSINPTAAQAGEILKQTGMVFLFAPLFHPAMKAVVGVRKALGFSTIFNILGPFANPAGIKRQLIGVPSIAVAEKLSQVAMRLDYERAMIVTSESGMDEASIFEKTYVYDIQGKQISRSILDAKTYGFVYNKQESLTGGDAKRNAAILRDVLSGKKNVYRDVVVLNSALALVVAGKAKEISEGINLANQSIDSGAARDVLQKFIETTQRMNSEQN